jgi:hypothetical protein
MIVDANARDFGCSVGCTGVPLFCRLRRESKTWVTAAICTCCGESFDQGWVTPVVP